MPAHSSTPKEEPPIDIKTTGALLLAVVTIAFKAEKSVGNNEKLLVHGYNIDHGFGPNDDKIIISIFGIIDHGGFAVLIHAPTTLLLLFEGLGGPGGPVGPGGPGGPVGLGPGPGCTVGLGPGPGE